MTAAKTNSQAKRDATVEAQRAIQRWSKLLSHTGSRSRASLPNLDQIEIDSDSAGLAPIFRTVLRSGVASCSSHR